MAKPPKIDKSKLPALHEYFEDGGSTEEEDIAAFLGIKATPENLAAWKAAYEEFIKPPLPVVKLRDATGILVDLEVIKEKDGTIYVQYPVVKDLVTILIGGKEVTVDCENLRSRTPTETVLAYGKTAQQLLALAELAR